MKYIFFIVMFSFFSVTLNAQLPGCTDPNAVNYDPNATANDGSCYYDPTFYQPPVVFQLPDQLDETSGLIMYDGSLWSHNDSGGEASIYRIDTASGQIVQEIAISGAKHVDWEDIARDEDYIYIGDFGNNNGNRDDLVIYKISKNDIPDQGNATAVADKIEFRYSDQKYAAKSRRENNFDCESMIVTDSIYLFSKNWGNKKTKLYVLPKEPGEYIAAVKAVYNVNGLVTAADLNQEKNTIVLCGYEEYVPFILLLWDYPADDYFGGNKRRIDFPQIFTAQTEGVCFYSDGKAFISAEETQTLPQRVYRVNTGKWTTEELFAIKPVFSEEIKFEIEPNPVNGRSFRILLQKIPAGEIKLQLFDSTGKTVYMGSYSIKPIDDQLRIKFVAAGYKDGLYLLKVSSGQHYATRKIIIQ